MRAGGLLVIALASCGRFDFELAPDAGIAFVEARRVQGGWGPIDLTTAGSVDWAHWGLVDTTSVNRKSGVAPQIGTPTHVGGGTLVRANKNDSQMDLAWTDGTPTPNATAVSTTLLIDTPNDSGDGFRFVVTAARVARTLRVFAGVWCGRLRFVAALDDPSVAPAVDTTWDFPASAYDLSTFEVDFQARTNPATLTITLAMDLNYCTTGDVGEVWLVATTLTE